MGYTSIITGASKAILEDKVCPLVESFLRDRGLELSLEKTRITHIDEGFDFLGQNIRKYGGKLLIKPAKKNVKAFLDKARKTVKGNLAAKQVNLIGLLNPIIRGWANYHRHVAAKETFSKADHRIWQALWQWCRRRHPKKGTRWIKAKYFKKRGTRNWVFAAETERIRPDGKPVMLELARADNTRIWRHIKIRAKANPFDPSWDSYFKERLRLLKGGISRDTDGGHSDFYPSAVISSLLQNASKPLWNAK